MFRKIPKLLLLLVLIMSVVSCGDKEKAKSASRHSKESLPIKSSYLRSTFYTAGIALATLINSETDFIAMNMSSAISENQKVESLGDGSAKLCFLSGPEAYMAFNGHPDYWERPQNISALFGFCPTQYSIIVKSAGIKKLEDLVGKRIAINSDKTVTGDLFQYLLELNGINSRNSAIFRVREPIGESMFFRGDVDAIWYGMGQGHSVFKDYLSYKTNMIPFRLISCGQENRLREFLTVYPVFYTDPLRVDDNISSESSLTSFSCLASADSLSSDTAYLVTRIWFENNDFIRQFLDFYTYDRALENALKLPIPMHQGAMRYFKEINLIK